MKYIKMALVLPIVLLACLRATAQEELVIGRIQIPPLKWGVHTASFEVTNNSDWMKYVTVETEIAFEGSYLNPSRRTHQYYPLEPGETKTLKPKVNIPGNYGHATMFVRVYDVVDTLDALMESQKVFEQPFKLNFNVPEAMEPYFSEKILFPPMVDNNITWDNEFAHVLPLLLSEGKSTSEIATMAKADEGFVKSVATQLVRQGFLYKNKDSSYRALFPVFTLTQAEQVKKIVEWSSDQMVDALAGNLDKYQAVIDSLVSAGSLTRDTNDFLNGGTVLYSRYPVVTGLLMWFDLGRAFITGRKPLDIFAQTNPCQARIAEFMYAVQGGDTFNGHQYYNMTRARKQWDIVFGDRVPEVECTENFMVRKFLKERVDFHYTTEYAPEAFIVSVGLVRPALNALADGTKPILEKIHDKLIEISRQFGFDDVSTAERYWFWNMFASRTTEKLVARGILQRQGNGQFRFGIKE